MTRIQHTRTDRQTERGGERGKKGREFVYAAGVISRLVCTRVFEPRVLFPLTDGQRVARGFPFSPLVPFLPLSRHRRTEPPSCSLQSPRNPRCLAAVSLLPPVLPSSRSRSPFTRLSLPPLKNETCRRLSDKGIKKRNN